MKKILLPVFALATSLVFAQEGPVTLCEDGQVGYSANGFKEDFTSATEIGGEAGGLYWWPGEAANFAAVIERNAAGGSLDVLVSQPYAGFTPFGVSFGDTEGDGTGEKNLIDLTNDATFSITVKNNHADSTIKVRVVLQDADGGEADSWGEAVEDDVSNAWKYAVETPIGPLQTVTLAGDYTGGVKVDWSTGSPVFDQSLDISKISGFLVTVINNTQNPGDNYNHYGLSETSISITDVQLGSCPTGVGLAETEAADAFAAFPTNATNGLVNFSEVATNLSVYNALGEVVETASKVEVLDVSNYEAGVYFFQADQGRNKFIVE